MAGDGVIRSDQVIDPGVFEATTRLKKEFAEIIAAMTGFDAQSKKSAQSIEDIINEEKKFSVEEEKSIQRKVTATKAQKEFTIATEKARLAEQSRKKEITLLAQVENAEANSQSKRIAQLNLWNYQAKKSDDTMRKMQPQIKKLTDEIKRNEESMGNNTRSVGFYEKAWKGVTGVLATITGVFATVAGVMKVTKDAIESAGSSSDKFAIGMGAVKEAYTEFLKTIATGDFSNFLLNMKAAIQAGKDYTEVIDLLQDYHRKLAIQEADGAKRISELSYIYKDATKTDKERISAIDEILRIEKELAKNRTTLAKAAYEAEIENAADLAQVTADQIKGYLNMDKAVMARFNSGKKLQEQYESEYKATQRNGITLGMFKKSLDDAEKSAFQFYLSIGKLDEKKELDSVVKLYSEWKSAETSWMDNTQRAWSRRTGMIAEMAKKEIKAIKSVNKSKMDYWATEKETTDLELYNIGENENAAEDAEKQKTQIQEEELAIRAKNDALYNDHLKAGWDETTQKELADAELKKQVEKEIADDKIKLLSDIQDVGDAYFERRMDSLDEEKARRIAAGEDEVKVEKDINKKKAKIKRNQAIWDKANGLIQVAINTALGVANAASKIITIPLIPFIIALGAAQAAIIALKKIPEIPQFWKGTKDAPGGASILGEHGSELVRTPGGDQFITPPVSTLMDLPRHSEVIPNDVLVREMQLMNAGGQYNRNEGITVNTNNPQGREMANYLRILTERPYDEEGYRIKQVGNTTYKIRIK